MPAPLSNTSSDRPCLGVLVVDDHPVVRVGLRNLINDEPDLRVVGEAATGAETLRMIVGTPPPAVVVLDLRLPDGSGVDLIHPIKQAVPGVRVLVLTSFADDGLLLSALKAGADGYLLKDVDGLDVIGSIRAIATAGTVAPTPAGAGCSPARAKAGALPEVGGHRMEALTGQERRVFELVGRGCSNREAAEAAGLTEKTVRNYLTRVFGKLGVRRRSELVALYVAGVRRQPAHRS